MHIRIEKGVLRTMENHKMVDESLEGTSAAHDTLRNTCHLNSVGTLLHKRCSGKLIEWVCILVLGSNEYAKPVHLEYLLFPSY